MTEWIVRRYVFNEAWKAWIPDNILILTSDKELLEYLRSQAFNMGRCRYEISVLLRPTEVGGGEDVSR
ncbi:MAG: hypothetical protein DRG33_02630 [Deltaproteobacteria bacterium]|nr:MAG: hypothetical protein DRG33_02630 [Deltaproteobacteria bacterium]